MSLKFIKNNWLILLILAVSFAIRVYKLNIVPPELFGDELDLGYQAYSILKTGKDYSGNFLPLYFQSLAEFRVPFYIYSAVPSIAIFGLNEVGVRLPLAIFGTLSVLGIFLLTKELLNKPKIAYLAALFLAISPWHLQYSRAAFETTFLPALLFGSYFLLRGFKKPKLLVITAVLFALLPYTYSAATAFLILFLIFITLIYKSDLLALRNKKEVMIAILLFFLILIPIAKEVTFGKGTNRFSQINIAKSEGLINEINLKREQYPKFNRIFYNKGLSFSYEFSKNYLSAFSPQFLFISGDPQLRHHVGNMGEFYWFQLPFFIFGLIALVLGNYIEKSKRRLLLVWLLISPIPSSLTIDGGTHATRLMPLIIPLIIIASIGTYEIISKISKNLKFTPLGIIICAIAFFNIVSYFHLYYVEYPKASWRWWQVGYKEAFNFIRTNHQYYDRIVINNTYEPALVRFLFYTQYDPAKFHKEFSGDKHRPQILPNIDGFALEKYYFGTLSVETKGANELSKVLDRKTLYLASQRDEIVGDLDLRNKAPDNVIVLKTIVNPFDKPIFYLLTGKNEN